MIKFIGAMATGVIAMTFAAYMLSRPKEQRVSDLSKAKQFAAEIVTNIKSYWAELMTPAPITAD